jgi:hypothetical protein
MIVFERAGAPAVRAGEWEIAGRRASARLIPYVGDAGGSFRFDPLELRFRPRRVEARVLAGPSDPRSWARELRGVPRGPVLIGPGVCDDVESIHESFLGAVAGAMAMGFGAYLLDPPPSVTGVAASLPAQQVVVVSYSPGGDWETIVAEASSPPSAVAAGLVLPLFPGWTVEEPLLSEIVDRAAGAGATCAAGGPPPHDGEARRLAVEALAQQDAAASDTLFERLHHRDWARELPDAARRLADAAGRRGLLPLPTRPRGSWEAPGNADAADALERRALESARQEHVSASYLAAARWVDECGRDLRAIRREGNFRRVFPFDGEVAAAAEAALGGGA